MRIIVQKYGGTSLGSIERIKAVARRVADAHNRGYAVVVVASAIGQTTDELMRMAGDVSRKPRARELGMLLATGEMVSSSLLAMALQSLGKAATSLTGAQCGITANGAFDKARIAHIDAGRVRKLLAAGEVVVVAGYQGQLGDDVAVLGRGGSDASAVALAAALQAEACQIYTDVKGVFTCDPRLVPEAQLLPAITYEEMLEMAASGAQIMMGRAVEIGRKYGVDILVASAFADTPGTLITKRRPTLEGLAITGIAARADVALIQIILSKQSRNGSGQILGAFERQHVNIRLLTSGRLTDGRTQLSIVVDESELGATPETLLAQEASPGIEHFEIDRDVALVSVVGYGIAENSGVAFEIFDALHEHGIDILSTSTSEIKISVIVPEQHKRLAAQVLHQRFGLDELPSAPDPASDLLLENDLHVA